MEAYVAVFDEFVARIRPGGTLVVCLADPGSAALARRVVALNHPDLTVLGYGVLPPGSGDLPTEVDGVPVGVWLRGWEPRDVGGVAQFQLVGEVNPRTLRLAVPGRHMALNAMGALLAAHAAGSDVEELVEGLAGFGGVHRRFQFTGREHGVRVFDDYAHHPTEVRAVLSAAAELVAQEARDGARSRRGHVIVVFQPHLYSRTQTFAAEFAAALDLADEVVVLDVYGAREEPLPGVSGAIGRAGGHQARALSARSVPGRPPGRGDEPTGRRGHHDGCRRRHHARRTDPGRAAVAAQTRAGRMIGITRRERGRQPDRDEDFRPAAVLSPTPPRPTRRPRGGVGAGGGCGRRSRCCS